MRIVLAALAAVVPLLVVPPAAAQVTGVAEGRRCSYFTALSSLAGDDAAQLNGGPLVATTPGATIALTCELHAGRENGTHAGAAVFTAATDPSPQVAVLPPAVFWYSAPEDLPVFVCSRATVDGVAYHWDDFYGRWSVDSGVGCTELISQTCCISPFWMIAEALDDKLGHTPADPLLCPVLGSLAPGAPGVVISPEGDVRISDDWEAWDCSA